MKRVKFRLFTVRRLICRKPHLLKGQCHEIFDFRFFSWISFPQAPLGPFRIFRKFAAQGAPPVSLTQVANGKNLQSEKFNYFLETFEVLAVWYCSGCLPPLLLTPAANLTPVSLTLVAHLPPVSSTPAAPVAKFAAGVVTLSLQVLPGEAFL